MEAVTDRQQDSELLKTPRPAFCDEKTPESERDDARDWDVGLIDLLKISAKGYGELRKVEQVLLID
jgi:hypothetical protein